MRPPTLDRLILLPREQAVQRWFDGRNYGFLRLAMAVLTPASLVGLIVGLTSGAWLGAALWGIDAVVLVGFYLARRTRFFETSFRQLLIVFVLLQLVIFAILGEPEPLYAMIGYLTPLVLLGLRVRWTEHAAVLVVSWGVAGWQLFREGMPEELAARFGMTGSVVVWGLALFWAAVVIRRRRAASFVDDWQRVRSSEQERSRMRDELSDARQAQLSMLPREVPELGWIELAAVSIPATEVGGDYYDHVVLNEDSVALVAGDVAGHGMASGLVLAAVRGGLHLLREELGDPVASLIRLDRMVREVASSRMFVTLQIAVVERSPARVRVANAGHPVVLKLRASDGVVEELGSGATPLGVRLESDLEEAISPLESGDVLLLYSDGAIELGDDRGEPFGTEGLVKALQRAGRNTATRQIRDSILDSLNFFKGDAALQDDLTLLVARIV